MFFNFQYTNIHLSANIVIEKEDRLLKKRIKTEIWRPDELMQR
jgi:hypothetical protein